MAVFLPVLRVGILVKDVNGKDVVRCGKFLGRATSNVAEYSALIKALQVIGKDKKLKAKDLVIKSDSKLLINQIMGNYRIKSKNLIPLVIKARKLLKDFNSVDLKLITRAENKIADKLANKSMNLHDDIDELNDNITAL
ncbi:hypothetical protein ES708_35286 [subsurface metagenome]